MLVVQMLHMPPHKDCQARFKHMHAPTPRATKRAEEIDDANDVDDFERMFLRLIIPSVFLLTTFMVLLGNQLFLLFNLFESSF